MGRKNNTRDYGATESRIVDALDEKDSFLDALTEEEVIAFKILCEAVIPDGRHTRDWADRVVRKVLRNRLMSLAALEVMRNRDIVRLESFYEYFVSKAPRDDTLKVAGDPDGAPVSVEVEAGKNFMRALMGQVDGCTRGLPDSQEKFEESDMAASEPVLDTDEGR